MLAVRARYAILSVASRSHRTCTHARAVSCVRVITKRFKVFFLQHITDLFHLVFVKAALEQQTV